MDKVRMRQVTSIGSIGFTYKVWQATYKGHTAYEVCHIWAYCEVGAKARRGF